MIIFAVWESNETEFHHTCEEEACLSFQPLPTVHIQGVLASFIARDAAAFIINEFS